VDLLETMVKAGEGLASALHLSVPYQAVIAPPVVGSRYSGVR